jgi:hypothetical protein
MRKNEMRNLLFVRETLNIKNCYNPPTKITNEVFDVNVIRGLKVQKNFQYDSSVSD